MIPIVLGSLIVGCGAKDGDYSNPQDDVSVTSLPDETATPFETIELKYLEELGARYVVPKGETWKVIWSRPREYGQVTPAYDIRFEGAIVLGNDQTISVSGVASPEFNVLALSKKEQSVVVWAHEGSKFYSANEYVKAKIEKYKAE